MEKDTLGIEAECSQPKALEAVPENKRLATLLKATTTAVGPDGEEMPSWGFVDGLLDWEGMTEEEIMDFAAGEGYSAFRVDYGNGQDGIALAAPGVSEEQIRSDLSDFIDDMDEVSITELGNPCRGASETEGGVEGGVAGEEAGESVEEAAESADRPAKPVHELATLTEGTANFKQQDGFDLYAIGWDAFEDAINAEEESGKQDMLDILAHDKMVEAESLAAELNAGLEHFEISIEPGYYEGLQTSVCYMEDGKYRREDFSLSSAKWDIAYDLEEYEGKTHEEAEAEAGRIIDAEVKKINEELLPKFKDIGFQKLVVVGRFSNGETLYEPVAEAVKDLCEGQWRKTVENRGLHQAIRDGDYDGIKDAAIGILREVESFLGDDSDTADLIDSFESLESGDEDECDYLLGELYDLCDNVGVFIKLDSDGPVSECSKTNGLKEAEGKREQGYEYVIFDASEDGKAPILATRSTRVEAESAANKLSKSGKYDSVSFDRVPVGKFSKGDDFWGPFDDEWNKISEGYSLFGDKDNIMGPKFGAALKRSLARKAPSSVANRDADLTDKGYYDHYHKGNPGKAYGAVTPKDLKEADENAGIMELDDDTFLWQSDSFKDEEGNEFFFGVEYHKADDEFAFEKCYDYQCMEATEDEISGKGVDLEKVKSSLKAKAGRPSLLGESMKLDEAGFKFSSKSAPVKFFKELANIFEVYDETDDPSDRFAGTEDSAAFETFKQHFDELCAKTIMNGPDTDEAFSDICNLALNQKDDLRSWIQANLRSLKAHGLMEGKKDDKALIEAVADIQVVTKDKINEVIDAEADGLEGDAGLFLALDTAVEPNKWIACDNTSHNAWTEEFDSEEKARSWLFGEFEVQATDESAEKKDKELVIAPDFRQVSSDGSMTVSSQALGEDDEETKPER